MMHLGETVVFCARLHWHPLSHQPNVHDRRFSILKLIALFGYMQDTWIFFSFSLSFILIPEEGRMGRQDFLFVTLLSDGREK